MSSENDASSSSSSSAAPLDPTNKPPRAATRSDSGAVTKRLQSELMQMMTSPPPGISAFPHDYTNLLVWAATITGPTGTPFDSLVFKLRFTFPPSYPYTPPTVVFTTPMFHPNIDMAGRICLDILGDKWSAVYNVQSVLLSLQSLLGEPNNNSPLNGQAAELWDGNPKEFKRMVLQRHKLGEN